MLSSPFAPSSGRATSVAFADNGSADVGGKALPRAIAGGLTFLVAATYKSLVHTHERFVVVLTFANVSFGFAASVDIIAGLKRCVGLSKRVSLENVCADRSSS